MKMLTLKNATIALISILLSNHAYAMVEDKGAKHVAVPLSPASAQEKDAFKRAI